MNLKNKINPLSLCAATTAQIMAAMTHEGDAMPANKSYEIYAIKDGVATIKINGFLGYDVPDWACEYGFATSYNKIIEAVKAIGANDSIGGVVVEINSGGGNVNGSFETARLLAALTLPKVAVVRSCACSAAYMLAAACDEIKAYETAELGSIGTIITIVDTTAADEQYGYKIIPITNDDATLKSIGIGSLTEEQYAFLLERANMAAATFQAFVLSRRPQLNTEVFNAATWSGAKALSMGLIDEIASY